MDWEMGLSLVRRRTKGSFYFFQLLSRICGLIPVRVGHALACRPSDILPTPHSPPLSITIFLVRNSLTITPLFTHQPG